MNAMMETVERYFEERSWHAERTPDAPVLRLGARGANGSYHCSAIADGAKGFFLFQSFGPENVPEARRAKAAEFLARLNWAVPLGTFAMDLEDGEVRFRTGIDVSGDRLSPALIENVIDANLVVMDRAWPLLEAVVTTEVTPEAAAEMLRAPSGPCH